MKKLNYALNRLVVCITLLVYASPVFAESTTSQILDNGSLVLHDIKSGIATAYRHGSETDVVWTGEALAPYKLTRIIKPAANGHLMAIARIPAKRVKGKKPTEEQFKTQPKVEASRLVELDKEGNVVWSFKPEDAGMNNYTNLHHDFFITPANTLMLLTSGRRSEPSVAKKTIIDDSIIEVDRQGNILWQWSVLDHIDQLGLDAETRTSIMNETPRQRAWEKKVLFLKLNNQKKLERVSADRDVLIAKDADTFTVDKQIALLRKVINDTQESPPKRPENSEVSLGVFHANAIQVLPENSYSDMPAFKPGNILMSLRNVNRVIIIDKDSGDIVWQLKVPTINQHAPRMIPEGLPGAGNILLFDNGGLSHYTDEKRTSSRILEIDPISHNILWRYEEAEVDNKPQLFSAKMSGAQRLPNGNTLILSSGNGRVFEVNSAGNIVWQRDNGKSIHTKRAKGAHYRAYWAPAHWSTSKYFNWW